MTVRTAPKLRPRADVRWTADDARGIGHAAVKGAPETACGRRVTDPRWAWPVERRCGACVVAVNRELA